MPNSADKPKKGQKAPVPQGPNLWMQLAAAFAIFLLLSVGYSFAREYITAKTETVPISQIASDITAGKITALTVEGDTVTATYTDETKKKSRKETESSLTETLSKYDIPPQSLSAVNITVQDEGGFRFWFLSLAPILVPALLLLRVLWYLSRQLRGGG